MDAAKPRIHGLKEATIELPPIVSDEEWEDTPSGRPLTPPYSWWRLHDEYEPGGRPG